MIYVNDEYIPSTFKYLVEASDNYIVLARDSYADGDWNITDTIDVKIQYFSPCTQVVNDTRSYNRIVQFTDISSQISNNIVYSRDYIPVLQISFIVLLCLCFLFNGFTRLFKKGRCLFSLV